MGFLLRMTFWFSLVLLALPMGGDDRQPEVGPLDALLAARAAVGDIAGLCAREPAACETGRAAFEVIGTRARESARIAYEILETPPVGNSGPTGADGAVEPQPGALTKFVPVPQPAPR